MKTTFIYALEEPNTKKIRYVGKANNPRERFLKHIKTREKTHLGNWIRALSAPPALEILDEVPFEYWQQWEVAYIEFFRAQGCDLTNTTPGGESPPSWTGKSRGIRSPEWCMKISTALKGRKMTPEQIAKRTKAQAGRKRPHSLEHKKAIGDAQRGKKRGPPSPETRQKIGDALRGRRRNG